MNSSGSETQAGRLETRRSGAAWLGGLRLLAVLAVIVSVLLWQRAKTSDLRDQLRQARMAGGDFERLRAENRRLIEEAVSSEELERLRGDRTAVTRLRAEIDGLERRVAASLTAKSDPARPEALADALDLPASEWHNAGATTVPATLETALWAAVTGDIVTLAGLIYLEDRVKSRVSKLIADLPDDARARYSSPEQWVAMATAQDIPIDGALRVRDIKVQRGLVARSPGGNQGFAQVSLSLMRNAESPLRKIFLLQIDGTWRLVVPISAVEKYEATVKGR